VAAAESKPRRLRGHKKGAVTCCVASSARPGVVASSGEVGVSTLATGPPLERLGDLGGRIGDTLLAKLQQPTSRHSINVLYNMEIKPSNQTAHKL
jgi:hypothetical protein